MSKVSVESCPVCGNEDLVHHLRVLDHSISKESFELVRCNSCGLVITQDHPDEAQIGKYYASDDYISHSDTQTGLVNTLYHRIRAYMLGRKRKLVESCHSSGLLLDIGCGTGYFPAYMQSNGWRVTGIEPDAGARAIAKTKFGLEVHDIDYLSSIPQRSLDVITMWHVLEHVHKLNETMRTLGSILKTDGCLVIAVPNYTSSDANKYGDSWAGYDVPRHLWHFAPSAMKLLLNRHGFTLQRTKGMPMDAFYVSMLSEKYRGNATGLILGPLAGLRSNLAAIANSTKSSSVIYVAHPNT